MASQPFFRERSLFWCNIWLSILISIDIIISIISYALFPTSAHVQFLFKTGFLVPTWWCVILGACGTMPRFCFSIGVAPNSSEQLNRSNLWSGSTHWLLSMMKGSFSKRICHVLSIWRA